MKLLMGVLCASLVGGVSVVVLGAAFALNRKRCGARYRKAGWILIALFLLLPLNTFTIPGIYTLTIPNIVLRQGNQTSADRNGKENADILGAAGITIAEETENMTDASDITGAPEAPGNANQLSDTGVTSSRKTTGQSLQSLFRTGEITTISVLFLLWVSVALLLAALYAVGFWQMYRRNMRWSRECQNEGILKLAAGISISYGLKKVPQIRMLEIPDSGPFTVGLRRKIIFLPEEGLMDRDVEYILRHEMVHCREHDIFWKVVFVTVNVVHWFNPFVWVLRKMVDQDMEVACDEAVLDHASMEQREEYSNVIMAWIERSQSKHQWNAFSTGYVTRHRFLKRRFAHIFDDTRKKHGGALIGLSVAILALVSVAIRVDAGERLSSRQKITIDTGIEVRTDVDGDGITDKVCVKDNKMGDSFDTRIYVRFGKDRDHYAEITYDDDVYFSDLIVGDLSGNGAADIVVEKFSLGSTYGGCAVSVLHLVDEELVEYPYNFIQNPSLDMEQPKCFANDLSGIACIGATIVEKDGKTLLRLVTLEDKWEETVMCIDCSYREDGWFIENIELVSNYYTDDRDEELLEEIIAY